MLLLQRPIKLLVQQYRKPEEERGWCVHSVRNEQFQAQGHLIAGTAALLVSSAAAAAARAAELKARNRKVAIYMASVVTAVLGISYAAVPLYKVFCQVSEKQGDVQMRVGDEVRRGGVQVRVRSVFGIKPPMK